MKQSVRRHVEASLAQDSTPVATDKREHERRYKNDKAPLYTPFEKLQRELRKKQFGESYAKLFYDD